MTAMKERKLIMQGFMFGIRVTEHVYDVKYDLRLKVTERIFDTIRQIAEGDLTLVDTPEEKAAEFGDLPEWLSEWLRANMPTILKAAREKERKTAQVLWNECREM